MDDSGGAAPGLRASLARFGTTGIGLLRTRLTLASVELAEERERLERRIALAFAGILALLFGVLTIGALVVIWFWDSYRYTAVIGVAAVLLAAGVLLLLQSRNVGRGATPFQATLLELERDRDWLARMAGGRGRDPGP
jgi:uncharacterized membrane protein YqjE